MDHPDAWATYLPDIVLALNNIPVDNNDFTPHQLTFGQSGRLPGSCALVSDVNCFPPRLADVYAFFHHMKIHHRKARPLQRDHHVDPAIETAEFVWLKNCARKHTLIPPYKGPYRVLNRATKWLEILQDNRIQRVSIDNTKPAFGFTTPLPLDEGASEDGSAETAGTMAERGSCLDEAASEDEPDETGGAVAKRGSATEGNLCSPDEPRPKPPGRIINRPAWLQDYDCTY